MGAAEQPGPFPLIVGSIGHKDLRPSDREATEKLVREFLESLKSRYPHTPIVLASSLNEGADRLIARVALGLGVRLIVPMPLMQAAYENDFETAESKSEFRELIRQADQRFSMPLLEGISMDMVREPGPHRDKQNALVGAWISQQCDYLIAIWDGVDRKLVGHPPHIVDMRLQGAPEPYARARTALDLPDTGPVLHIRAARASKPGAVDPPSATLLLPKSMQTEASVQEVLERLDEFNREAAGAAASEGLIPEKVLRGLPESAQRAAKMQGQAQAVAARLDAAAQKGRGLAPVLAFLGFAVLVAYAFLAAEVHVLVLAAAGLLGAACYFETRSRNDASPRCAADSRALADALRVQFFWKITGVEEAAEMLLLRRRPGDWQWIRKALRGANLPITGEKSTGVPDGPQLALDYWLKSASQPASIASGPGRLTVPLTAAAAVLAASVFAASFGGGSLVRGLLLTGACLALGSAAYVRVQSGARQGGAVKVDLSAAAARMEILLAKQEAAVTRRFIRDTGREVLATVEHRLVAERQE